MDPDDVWLGVDVGGTFTDVVLLVGDERTTAKVPTTGDQSEGVVAGVERACSAAGIDPADVDRFRHGTTVAVNALLERAGGRTALVTTAGFRDVLAIRRQDRPGLYDLDAERPAPLVPRERRFEVPERTTPEGVERRPTEEALATLADDVAAADPDSVAVCLLHAYAHPQVERRVADRLRDRLDVPVTASREVLATFREYERTATTVAEAYLTPPVADYLARLESRAADLGLPAPRVVQGNGGIADAATARENAATTVLSGPAAGVVGAARVPDAAGEDAVTLDMGGTSTDVALVTGGDVERTRETDVGGHPVRLPTVDVNTVGAGGGSVAWVDEGGALRVGPRSAGADPGPACYGRGGTAPTVTDAAVLLGYLGPETTLGAGLSLDEGAAADALRSLASEAGLDGPLAAARGVFRVATATMARAVRGVTVERGHDPREFALAAFGGAGPMHAAALADDLGMERVVVPPAEGVLSALGLLAADERHDAVRTHRTALAEADEDAVADRYADLREEALAESTAPEAATVERTAACRYAGQAFELSVDVPTPFDAATVAERFHAAHERARGYRLPGEPVALVTLGVTARIPGDTPIISHEGIERPRTGARDARFGEALARVHETPVFDRERVKPGVSFGGPAVFEGGETTVVLPPEWTAEVTDTGALVLEVAG
ncbi:MAG: hydantoinase/oxoprolinase family protein [Halorientalis sp.]